MVERPLAPKWTPLGFWQRFSTIVRKPSDMPLAIKMGLFMCRAPINLEKASLPDFLATLRARSRPAADDMHVSMERIVRLRTAWLRLPFLRARNTCYLRAFTLYRFLDAGDRTVGIHFGIQPPAQPGDRLRGHAWVTVDGRLLEGPEEVARGGILEIPVGGRRS
jgi:transglutaminase superfamily protein